MRTPRPVSRCYFDLLGVMPESDRLDIATKINARSVLESEPNVLVGTPCRTWLGERGTNAYGLLRIDGRQAWPVHRVALALAGQRDASTLVTDHLCRNRSCVRVDHLELTTNRQNTLRGLGPSAQNALKVLCIRGHLIGGENLYVDHRGNRRCRICHAFLTRRSRARRQAKAAA
jgi:hypothetical protein